MEKSYIKVFYQTNVLFIIMILVFSSLAAAENINPSVDVVYEGAFQVPYIEEFQRSGHGMTFYPKGDGGKGSLFISMGNVNSPDRALVSEISLATPVNSKNASDLNRAKLLQPFTDISKIRSESMIDRFGDVAYLEKQGDQTTDKLYWVAYQWYNTANTDYPSLGYAELDFTNPNAQGTWDYAGANLDGMYIFSADKTWADTYVNGRYLLTGRCRGGGNNSSRGPNLYAVAPWNSGNPPANHADLPATLLLQYNTDPDTFPETNFPDYAPNDYWHSGAFIKSGDKQAILITGEKCTGGYSYEPGGWVCHGSIENWMLWYSVDDITAVAQGTKQPNEPIPYSTLIPGNDISWHGNGFGGVGYDQANQKLYVVEVYGGYSGGGDNLPIVHVFSISGGVSQEDSNDGSSDIETDGDGDGYLVSEGDCNDNNASVFPGASEICGDGIDQDCSGSDETCPEGDTITASGSDETYPDGDTITSSGSDETYPEGDTITVSTSAELLIAVSQANNSGGNKTISLKNGTYTVEQTLYISAPNVTITGESGNRSDVIIQGDAMSDTAQVTNVITVGASNFTIQNVTLQKSRWHIIQVRGEDGADYFTVKNCIIRDSYQQLLKVSPDNAANPIVTSDNGLVDNCLFEYSAKIGPQCYIGGIDAHGSKNWTVRNNTFRYIISPSTSAAEFAIHFWNKSANNLVEKNRIIDCDRGIGFGLDDAGNTGGIIRNNMIYHSANAGNFADVSIALIESPNSQVYNNTVFLENDFSWAIEYRFASTTSVVIKNNLLNKTIALRDGASGYVTNNVTSAQSTWFINASSADLHLNTSVPNVVDQGVEIDGLADDYDGDNRTDGQGIDIGADEIVTASVPAKPTGLQITFSN